MADKKELGQEILRGNKRTVTKEIDLTNIDKRYIGDFTFQTVSLMDKMQVGIIKSTMLKGIPAHQLDATTQNIAHMSATLTKACTDYPKWFDLDNISEYIVLETIYDAYVEWENSFRTGNSGNDDAGDSEGTGE